MAAKARNGFRRGVWWAGLVAVGALLTWAAYDLVVGFPFLFDDLIHLRWLAGRSVASVWVDVEEMQHYRPLVISLWAISQRLFGAHNAVPLHWLTLFLHALNGMLAGLLAREATDKDWAGVLAAALFVTFPFSYQVMPSPGSLSKPISTLLILGAVLLYCRGRILRRPVFVGLAVVLAILCPFAYEAGLTAGGYLVLAEFLLWRTRRTERFRAEVFLAVLSAAPFLFAWYKVPQTGEPIAFPGWEALWQSSVYFVQALTWPVALLAKPLMHSTGLSDGNATALVGYLALAAILVVYLLRRRLSVLWLVLGWYLLSLGVQWVTLSFRYVIDGPRILYAGSVTVALLWADLATMAWEWPTLPRKVGLSVGTLAVIAMSVWGVCFCRQRMLLCQDTVSLLQQASRQAIDAPSEERLLFVNLPSWFAPDETGFALGHEGYTIMPPYYDIGLDDFLLVNYGVERETVERGFADIRQEWRAELNYHGQEGGPAELAQAVREAGRVFVTTYHEGELSSSYVGGKGEQGKGADSFQALYGESIALTGAGYRQGEDHLVVTLDWHCLSALEGPYTVFVHLYSSDGALLSQADGIPLGGVFSFAYWQPGDAMRDVRYLPLPTDQESAVVGVGLYRSDTGERAVTVDGTGRTLVDGTWRMPLE